MTATLYGAKGGSSGSNLYTIDQSTAAQTSVGPITNGTQVYAITGLAFDPTDGTLYGITSKNSPHSPSGTSPGHLLTIDPTTGAATEIGFISGTLAGQTSSDLAFDASGQLYGFLAGPFSGHRKLWKIDKATVAVTEVGPDIGFNPFGGGLDWRASDNSIVAFLSGGTCASCTYPTDPWGRVRVIDPATGTVTDDSVIISGGPFTDNPGINAAKFDGSGVLWAVVQDFTPGSWRLVTIDPATGVTTNVGTLADNFDALAWSPAPAPPPANDLCANATVIGGVSGSTSGTTAGAGKETPDALDAWFSTTIEHSVFFEYTAPSDGYIEFTIDKPGGSTLNKMAAGVMTGACGSQTVDNDPLLGQQAVTDVTSFPAVVGHQVAAGDVLYLEIADHSGSPGDYDLAWSLRTITLLDCPADPVQFGPDVIDPADAAALESIAYCRDAAGNHWIAYWLTFDGGLGTENQHFHVAMLPAAGGSWTDWEIATFDAASFTAVVFPLVSIATDGTKVWAACTYNASGDEGFYVFEYGAGSWPQVATLPPSSTGGAALLAIDMTASTTEPGVAYVLTTDNNGSTPGTVLTKVDDTTTLWSVTIATLYGKWSLIRNGHGSPILFFNEDGTSLVTMYAVNPSTGAVTSLQSFDYTELGLNSSAGTPHVNQMIASRDPFLEAVSGETVYYLAVQWDTPTIPTLWEVLRVEQTGAADFDYFDKDSSKALAPGSTADAGGILPEADNVWIPRNVHMSQFDRKCDDAWQTYDEPALIGERASQGPFLDSDTIYDIGNFFVASPPAAHWGVAQVAVQRDGCFCSIGPEVALGRFYAQVV